MAWLSKKRHPLNTSQKWAIFLGLIGSFIGLMLLILPIHADAGLTSTVDCGSALGRLVGDDPSYDRCVDKINSRAPLALGLLIGGVAVASIGRTFFADSNDR